MKPKHAVVTRIGSVALSAFTVIALIFLVISLVVIVPMSFTASGTLQFPPPSWSIENYSTFFASPGWMRALLNSVYVGLLGTIIAVLVATPTAYAINISGVRGSTFVQLLVLLPLMIPLIVIAVATYSHFAPRGLSDSILGLGLVHGLLGIPLAFLAINPSFEQFDRTQLAAAQSLGAKPITALIRVVLPAIRPGLVTGALFAFVFSFNEVVTVIFLGGSSSETLPKRMWDGILLQVDPIIAVVATVMILLTVCLLGGAIAVRHLTKKGSQ